MNIFVKRRTHVRCRTGGAIFATPCWCERSDGVCSDVIAEWYDMNERRVCVRVMGQTWERVGVVCNGGVCTAICAVTQRSGMAPRWAWRGGIESPSYLGYNKDGVIKNIANTGERKIWYA